MSDTIVRKISETMEAAETMAPGRLEWLQAAGLDILESRREGHFVYDQHGTRYIDAIGGAGTFNLGRRRLELVEELKRAMHETDQGNFPMISKEKALLAQALADFVPGKIECIVFAVSRGEAFDAACKLARGHTGRPGLVTVDGGWYGHTGFALSLSDRSDKSCFGPTIPACETVAFGDIAAADAAISSKTAAFILELVQAENGCREVAKDYVRAIAEKCRQREVLLIVDETQTNFGRVGSRFAFEDYGIEPDLMVVGEALCGGVFPIAATLMTPAVKSFMDAHPLIHLSTFGGTDIGCRVAVKALEIYTQEHPWENAATIGTYLRNALDELVAKPNLTLSRVNGRGLLLALELESEPAALEFCRRLVQNGLLCVPGMVAKNTVVLRPDLNIDERLADAITGAIAVAAGL